MRSVNIVPGDSGACAHYRLIQVGNLLQYMAKDVNISPAGKFRALNNAIIYTQRITTETTMKQLIDFKKSTNSKFIVDYDDLVWVYNNETVPEYNNCKYKIDADGNTISMSKYLDELTDNITVSTPMLKEALSSFVSDPNKILIMPNRLSYREWYFPRTNGIPKEDIFYYAGSSTHYDNNRKLQGDFETSMINYLNNKKVLVKGSVPYFIKPSATFPANMLNSYAVNFYKETRYCKFIIAPLVNNIFNKCKSNLKYLESCAVGRVCLVSDFPGSPFEDAHPYQKIPLGSTRQAIEFIVERASKNYEEILNYQYEYLNKRWLDNSIGDYVKLLELE